MFRACSRVLGNSSVWKSSSISTQCFSIQVSRPCTTGVYNQNFRYFHSTIKLWSENNGEPRVPEATGPSSELEALPEVPVSPDAIDKDLHKTDPSAVINSTTPVEPPATPDIPEKKTPEQIKAERKARKEKKKKSKQAKEVLQEDEVEKKKRLRKEHNLSLTYTGDGSEIDISSPDLNDSIIIERITQLYDEDNDRDLLKLRHKLEKENVFIGAMMPSQRYWIRFGVEKNPYTRIRFAQAYSKWGNRDLRKLSNEEYQNQKFNTAARMNATVKNWEIFPDVVKKFTPTINLLAEYNCPIARDILVYYGNVIPAQFTEKAPKITFQGNKNALYTLMLVDGKNTGYLENYGQSVQWLITNIRGEDGDITKGNELVEYLGATPLKEFGANRMVFLLFKQRFGRLELDDFEPIKKNQLLEREPFDVKEFALQNELVPRGLSFYTCTYDKTVPQRFEKLGYGEPQFVKEEQIERKIQRKLRKDITREVTSKKWTWPDHKEVAEAAGEPENQEESLHPKE